MSDSNKNITNNCSPRVAIIILNYNDTSDTIRCLMSLNRINYPNIEIILVDNMSNNDNGVNLRKICKHPFHIIKLYNNYGVCVARNIATRVAMAAGANYFFYLDNDTIIEPDILNELIVIIEQNPCIGALQPKVCLFNTNAHQLSRQEKYNRPVEDYLLLGCALLISKEAIVDIGLFDPAYTYYCEETDWLCRLKRRGYVSLYIPSASRVFHKGSNMCRWIKSAMALRNRFLLIRRYESIFKWPSSILFNLMINGLPILRHGKLKTFAKALFEGIQFLFVPPSIPRLQEPRNYLITNDHFFKYLVSHEIGKDHLGDNIDWGREFFEKLRAWEASYGPRD